MFAEDSLVRLGGSGKINWKSVASEDAPVKADSHRPAATRSRRKRKITGKKCEEAISRRSAATGEKKKMKKKKNTAKPNCAKPHNGTGRCTHACWGARGDDARQASQVHGWQTRSFGVAILILGWPLRAASGSRPRENAVVP